MAGGQQASRDVSKHQFHGLAITNRTIYSICGFCRTRKEALSSKVAQPEGGDGRSISSVATTAFNIKSIVRCCPLFLTPSAPFTGSAVGRWMLHLISLLPFSAFWLFSLPLRWPIRPLPTLSRHPAAPSPPPNPLEIIQKESQFLFPFSYGGSSLRDTVSHSITHRVLLQADVGSCKAKRSGQRKKTARAPE